MSIISDHKPHVPWLGHRAVIRKRGGDEHHVEQASIAEWLTVEPPRVSPTDLPGTLPLLEAEHITVHTELDDDQVLAEQLLTMERETHALADTLSGENDTRMTLLLARLHQLDQNVGAMVSAANRAWEATSELLLRVLVTRRRKAAITPLVLELGTLVRLGDVSPESAAVMVALRSRFLHATDADSQRIPRLTPDLLATLDAERGVAA